MGELKQVLWDLSNRAGIPIELLPGIPSIELAGDRAIMIETHCGIGAYTEEQIVVLLKIGSVTVEGTGLQLHRMDRSKIVITGRICNICLERN